MRSWFQSFPEVPSQHPTVELKAGCREQFKLHSHSEDTESLPEDITSLSDSDSSLDWPGSLTPPQFKVCFWSRPALFPISGVDCTPLAIERRFQDKSYPTQSCGRTHHSSSGQLAACSFPLWTKMLPGPDFWHCLSFSQSSCLLAIFKKNIWQWLLLNMQWWYLSDRLMDDPMLDPGY